MRRAVCILVFNNDGKILSISRRNNPNQWGLVGGKVDDGELSAEAMAREFKEEVGVHIHAQHLEPLYCGVCYGEENFFCTTFMYPYTISEERFVPEEGMLVKYLDVNALTDSATSPFALYNIEILAALHQLNS